MLHLDPLGPTGDLEAWVVSAEEELEAGFPALLEEVSSVGFDAGLAVFELSNMIDVGDGATYIRVEDKAVDVESGKVAAEVGEGLETTISGCCSAGWITAFWELATFFISLPPNGYEVGSP